MASNRQWYVYSLAFLFALICAPASLPSARRRIAPTGVSGCLHTLQSRGSASNHKPSCLPRPSRTLPVPETRPPCRQRHVVLFSTIVHFPATLYAKEHKHLKQLPLQFRLRC